MRETCSIWKIILFFLLIIASSCNESTDTKKSDEHIDTADISGKKDVLALVVGMGDYWHLQKLKFAGRDADSMVGVLKSYHIDVMPCVNVSMADFRTVFEQWSENLKNYKVGLFYYSGHGAEIYGKDFLFPVSTPNSISMDLNKEAINLDSVLYAMYQANTKMNLIFLDACRDNPFPTKGLFPKGLASAGAIPTGTFIGFSASPGSVSLDDGRNNSVYTEAILKNIRRPDLTIDQIFNIVNADVRLYTKGNQIPFKNSSLDADFYFNVSKKADITKSLNLEDKSIYSDNIRKLFPSIAFGSNVGDVISAEYGEQYRETITFDKLIRAFECKGQDIRYYLRKLNESNQFAQLKDLLRANNLDTLVDDQSYVLYQFKGAKLFRVDIRLLFKDIAFHRLLLNSLQITDEKYTSRFFDYNKEFFTILYLDPKINMTSILLGEKDSYSVCSNDWFSSSDTVNLSMVSSPNK